MLTDAVGGSVQLNYVNPSAPSTPAVLATVLLTNSPQFYFDTSAIGQPAASLLVVGPLKGGATAVGRAQGRDPALVEFALKICPQAR